MRYLLLIALAVSGCATAPKCGNPVSTNTVYMDSKTCDVRIRQVVIGSKLQIPESLKGSDLASYEMTWVESKLVDGKIQLGHFALIPKTGVSSNE